MKVFKERGYVCDQCGARAQAFAWDSDPTPDCAHGHGAMVECSPRYAVAPQVVDDQIEGGPRFFEHLGHEKVWIESKSQLRRELDKRNLVNVVRHDADYYAKRRKWHDEERRDTGRNVEY